MNREVELVLSGLHASGQEQESEAVETVQTRHNILRETTVIICSMRRKWIKTKVSAVSRSNSGIICGIGPDRGQLEMHMIFEENKRLYDPV